MKKLFGEINMTWKKVIIFSIIIGVYVALINQVPTLKDTSFRDIAISFEWWILFGIIIIMNSKSPLDSALKCFIFFLISQPLIYLVQDIIGSSDLFHTYYRNWIKWTIACLPMGYIGYYLKKDKWYGLIILTPIIVFLGYHALGFLRTTMYDFPKHLLSYLFCIITMLIYPICIYKNKKIKTVGLIISLILIVIFSVIPLLNKHVYETEIFCNSEENPVDITDKVSFKDEKYGEVSIIKEKQLDEYCIHVKFRKTGKTQLIIESNDNNKRVYDLKIGNNTYDYKLRK